MSNLVGDSIFSLLRDAATGRTTETISSIPEDVTAHISNHANSLTVSTDASGFESEVTGNKLASWIQPLHFEKNLNAALDALEVVEALLAEDRQILLTEIQQNFFRGMLSSLKDSGNGNTDPKSVLDAHDSLSKKLDFESYKNNLALRLAKKLTDLIEYTKAAKLGAKLLYGIESKTIEYIGDADYITRIRESLRKLLEQYRELVKKDQEDIVPISLKYTKNISGNYLVAQWADEAENPSQPVERSPYLGLKQNPLVFDLSQVSAIADLPFQRLRRLGVQVIDMRSGIGQKSDGTYESEYHPNQWSFNLLDDSGGFPLGRSALADKHQIGPIRYSNVAGSRSPLTITWSKYASLININANRRWKIHIVPQSQIGSSIEEIRDIILHFHLSYQIG